MKTCKFCGESHPDNFYKSVNARECKKCFIKRTTQAQVENRKRAVSYKGGKCVRCGYDRYIGALHFHHRDKTTKDPKYSSMIKWSWERQQEELDKCDLLCANCHAEVHAGYE